MILDKLNHLLLYRCVNGDLRSTIIKTAKNTTCIKIRTTQNILMTKYCEGTKDTIPECHNNIPTILSRKLFMLYSQSNN